MKTASCVLAVLLTFALAPQGGSQHEMKPPTEQKDWFATRRAFSKGGIGIVNKHLYIVVKSASDDRNELVVAPTEG